MVNGLIATADNRQKNKINRLFIKTIIASDAVLVHAQKVQPGQTELNGHISAPTQNGQESGGGHVIVDQNGNALKCKGSSGFKSALGC